MTERSEMRKPAQLNLRTATGMREYSDSDSVATDSTVQSEHGSDDTYEVEDILAERRKDGGETEYLVKWAHYPEERWTFEPENNISDKSLIVNWKATLAQQKAGKLEAFDLAAWELNVERIEDERNHRKWKRKEKLKRRRRRDRRSASKSARPASRALTSEDSGKESPLPRKRLTRGIRHPQAPDSPDREKQTMAPEGGGGALDDSLTEEPLRIRKRLRKGIKLPLAPDFLEEEKESVTSDGVESESDDSLLGELMKREARRQLRSSRGRASRENTKPLQETQKHSEPRASLQRSTDWSDPESPLLGAGEISQPSRTASRDSLQEPTQPPSMSAVGGGGDSRVPTRRPRGRPPGSGGDGGGGAIRGGSRGRGRSGALPATSHVFSKSEVPKIAKKSLSHSLSADVTDPDPFHQPELSKNLSHVRKLGVAGRAKADRAPDLTVLGGLFNPAEIKGGLRAYPILKPRDFRQPDAQSQQPSGSDTATTSAPPSRRSSTNRVRFLDASDDESGVTCEEPGSIMDNDGNKGQNIRDSPYKGQIVERGNDRPDVLIQSKTVNVSTKLKPILRTPTTSSWAANNEWVPQEPRLPRAETVPNITSSNLGTSNEWPSQQPLLPRPEPISTTISTHIASSHVSLPSNAINFPESVFPALDPKTSTGERKKVSLSEYNAKQRIEKGGNLVKQASFGTLDTTQTPIAFSGVSRSAQELWVKEINSLDAINFVHLCTAGDFQAQPPFVKAKVLGHGSIAANSEATGSLDRLSEHLRLRLGGLMFSHHTTAILLFPTRLDEWKFLETAEVPNTVALRYHIFELPEFCKTIYDHPIGITPSGLNPEPPYWSSAVGFLCGLKYGSLLPPVLPSMKEQDRDNFFLLIPENATPSPRFLTTWLKSCKQSCKVLSSQKPGSWGAFINHSRVKGSAGTVLIHESFISQIPKLPHLQILFSSKCNFAIFSLSSCPIPRPILTGISTPTATLRTRLFPLGAAFFLAPSLLIADPKNVCRFLHWFRKKQEQNSTPGTYKLLGCHGMKEFVLDIAVEKFAERRALIARAGGQDDVEPEAIKRDLTLSHNTARFKNYLIIEEMIDNADANLPPGYDLEDLDEGESPVILASEHIAQNDEFKLLSWFAGWALLNVDKYKKFWVIGTDPTNIHKAVRISPTNNELEAPIKAPISEVANLVKATSSSTVHDGGVRWKKTGFTPMTEITAAPLFSTVASASQSNICDDNISPLSGSPAEHQAANWSSSGLDMDMDEIHELDKLISRFIEVTGSNSDDAITYLVASETNLQLAIECYRKGRALSPHPAQAGEVGAQDTSNPSGPNIASGSQPSPRSGVVTEEDERRIVPASIRSNGSTRKEIRIRPGYVSQEDKEVWRSQTVNVLSMLPRSLRQSNLANIANSRQRTIDRGPGATLAEDESGDVVMNDANQEAISLPPHLPWGAQVLAPPNDDQTRRTESCSSGIFVTEDERSPSRGVSPSKQDVQKDSSLPLTESTTDLLKRMEKERQLCNHIRVLGVKEAFLPLGINIG